MKSCTSYTKEKEVALTIRRRWSTLRMDRNFAGNNWRSLWMGSQPLEVEEEKSLLECSLSSEFKVDD